MAARQIGHSQRYQHVDDLRGIIHYILDWLAAGGLEAELGWLPALTRSNMNTISPRLAVNAECYST